MKLKFIPLSQKPVDLGIGPAGLPVRHRFEKRQIEAVNAALSADRPLLVRGEPGVGKSQLARAAAMALGRTFVQHVVDSRTEARDLQWHFDAVGRLAKAQVMGALQLAPATQAPGTTADLAFAILDRELAVEKFLYPRALWWAFNWTDAKGQAKTVGIAEPMQDKKADPRKGCVVLIDEIDKAETEVPNGLLEALGNRQFLPLGRSEPVKASNPSPLVIITTNEERTLPDAFVRRCLVLHLALPKDPDRLIRKLVSRGKVLFRDLASDELLQTAAELLAQDRAEAQRRHWRPLPGQAEYLDLVRSVVVRAGNDAKRQETLINEVAGFVFKKHPDAAPSEDDADEDIDDPGENPDRGRETP